MDSFTPYHLPVILLALLGVSALVLGGSMMYGVSEFNPEYHYSVNEYGESSSNSHREVIQFTDLSETGQEVFLEALDKGRYTTNQELSEFTISSKYPDEKRVIYQDQTYVFKGSTDYNSWWVLVFIIYGFIAGLGVIAMLLGGFSMKHNRFKLPTTALSAALVIGLQLNIELELIEQLPRVSGTIFLVLLCSSALVWGLLWGIERHWSLSFSQRMDQ
ncbi:hypothetical protein [Halosolutus halophilus]|uniref:hypothetical protein n=1 Tax=Halosolutus halophilus TaxID=1552990 RepID=UPI0022350334|nr:hypothetical protein [Halosolutus halophilus]